MMQILITYFLPPLAGLQIARAKLDWLSSLLELVDIWRRDEGWRWRWRRDDGEREREREREINNSSPKPAEECRAKPVTAQKF